MRILAIHSGYRRPGGEDISFRSEVDLLRVLGHQVAEIQIDSGSRANRPATDQVRSLLRGDRDFEKRLFEEVAHGRPDVIYLNNWFPWVAPSIPELLDAAPVLAAVRNYRLWCINGLFFRSGKGCVECLSHGAWRGVAHGCYEGHLRSLMATRLSTNVRHELTSRSLVHFTAASQYVARFLETVGITPERIHVKANVVHPEPVIGSGGERVLFVGRLEEAKGFADFVSSCRAVGARMAVIGEGPLQSLLSDDEYLGQLRHDQVLDVMGRSRVTVMPSLSHETFGRVAAESLGCGTPAIVSSSGALPEVGDESCVQVVEAGDRDMLSGAIRAAVEDHYWSATARTAAREAFMRRYSSRAVASQLESALQAACGAPGRG